MFGNTTFRTNTTGQTIMPEFVDKPLLAEVLAEYIRQTEIKGKIDDYMETEPMKPEQTATVQDIATTTIQEILTTNQYVTAPVLGSTYATKTELRDTKSEWTTDLASKVDSTALGTQLALYTPTSTLASTYATKSDLATIDTNLAGTYATKAELANINTGSSTDELRTEMYRNFDNFDTMLSQNYLTQASLAKRTFFAPFNPGLILNGTYQGIEFALGDGVDYRNRFVYLLPEGGPDFTEPQEINILMDTLSLEEYQEVEIYNSCTFCKILFRSDTPSRMLVYQNGDKTIIPPKGRGMIKNIGKMNSIAYDQRDYFFVYGDELVNSSWTGPISDKMTYLEDNMNSILQWQFGAPVDTYVIEPRMIYLTNHNGCFLYLNPYLKPEPSKAVFVLGTGLQGGSEIVIHNGSSVTCIVFDTSGYNTIIYRDPTKTALSPKGTVSIKHIPAVIRDVDQQFDPMEPAEPNMLNGLLILGNLQEPPP